MFLPRDMCSQTGSRLRITRPRQPKIAYSAPSSRPACRAVPQASRHKMTETASKIELFGKWTYDDVEINDISLEDYIAVG